MAGDVLAMEECGHVFHLGTGIRYPHLHLGHSVASRNRWIGLDRAISAIAAGRSGGRCGVAISPNEKQSVRTHYRTVEGDGRSVQQGDRPPRTLSGQRY